MRPSLLNSRRASLSRKRRKAGRSRRRLGTASLRLEPLEERTLLSLNPAMLADIQTGTGGSSPTEFTEVGETTFFVAYHGHHGTELWKTDGTVSGTMIVKDIDPGSESYTGYANGHWYDGSRYFSSSPQDLTNVNGTLYFTADDGEHGRELWKSDGTEDGTVMVKDVDDGFTGSVPNASDPQSLTAVGGTLYFTADDGDHGRELWKSDGTGTVMVKDIDDGSTGSVPNASDPQSLTAVDGTLYFTADDGTNGRELWKSDGTPGGTEMVADVFPDSTDGVPNSSDPQHLTAVDGTLYFTADDGASGRELWKSDGTGTVMLDDLYTDSTYDPSSQTDVPNSSDPQKLTDVGGTLFFTAYTEDEGRELWTSDGTQGGAVIVQDIVEGTGTDPTYGEFPKSSSPDNLTDVNGTLFFTAYDEDNGHELWTSDGTPGGAVLVKDIFPDDYYDPSQGFLPNSSYPMSLTNVGGTLFFTAYEDDNGGELWKSDGTPDGTVMVKDIYSGATDSVPNSSDPQSLAYADGRLYFAADDGTHGEELWMLPVATEAIEAEAHLSIFIYNEVAGKPVNVAIPVDVGVDAQGNISTIYTVDAAGTLKISPVGDEPILDPVTLGHFFDTWKDNPGLADENPDAVFNEGEILGHTAVGGYTIQMFVNGQANLEFEDYGVRDGDEIVIVYTSNEVVSLNTNLGSILIELYEEETPITVSNFLNYVNDGDYINSFFHRSDPGFVIQGGGFKTAYTHFYGTYQFSQVPNDGTIQNEPGIPNTEATVAMARVGGQVHSATSQFFVNLADNPALDGIDGGFTVFGRVLDMTTVDAIETLDVDDTNAAPYAELPLTDDRDLVVIQSIGGEGDLSGRSFDDENFDGVQGTGEDGLAGATVFVDANDNGVLDDGEVSTVTDTEGDWGLRLPAGTYVIRQEPTGSLYPTTPDGTARHSVTVEIGHEIDELDFANVDNVPPVAVADEYEVDEDTPLPKSAIAGVLSNDTDEEGDDLDAVLVDPPEHGELTSFNDDGSFTYTPEADFNGIDTFTYRAQDQYGQSAIASVEITVNPVDDTPIAVDDAFTLPEGAQAHELDVLDNDSDADGQTVTITEFDTGSAVGTVAITNNGATIEYTPQAGFSGTETFTYTIEDPDGLTDEAEVTVTVNDEANQTPGSISGYVYWDCDNDGERDDGEFGIYGVLVTLTGEDDESNSVSESLLTSADGSYFFDDLAPGTYTVTEQQPEALVDGKDTIGTSGGDDSVDDVFSGIVLSANEHSTENNFGELGLMPQFVTLGMFLASTPPAAEYFPELMAKGEEQAGNTDLAAQIRDGITDDGENDAPTNQNDTYSVDEDQSLAKDAASGVLHNDSDPDGDVLTALKYSEPNHGTLTLSPDGSFIYIPESNYHGPDSFTYTVSDGSLDSTPATVSITVNSVNDVPETDDDDYPLPSGGALTIDADAGVLGNDSDADGDDLDAVLLQDAQNGDLALDEEDGSFTYTPDASFHGEDTFTYRAYDGTEYSGETTVTITVNDVPQANDDSYTVDEDDVLTKDATDGVLHNDTDADGDTLTITVDVWPANGQLTYDPADGSFEYTPNPNFHGDDYFTYKANDGYADSDTVRVDITVIAVNDAPVAVNDEYTAKEGLTLVVDAASGVLSNDSDVEGSELSPVIGDSPANGSVSAFGPGGSFSYTPDASFIGTDTFTYTVSDGELESNEATVTIVVVAVEVPTAVDDEYDVNQGEQLSVPAPGVPGVLDNDLDLDPTFDVVVVDDVDYGTLAPADDGSFTYTPTPSFTGDATFTYKLSDGPHESNVATVTITVHPDNDAPTTGDPETYEVDEDDVLDVPAAGGLLANDSDVDGSPDTPLTSLVITEIHYNPIAYDTYTSQQLEFIELQNIGDATIDLTGVQFTQGITFDFTGSAVTELAPNETVLVVANQTAFEARYGTGLNVAGEFTGDLDDDGEQIVLKDSADSTIQEFTYDDEALWPTEPDGGGKTLEVDDVTGDYSSSANWLASDDDGGTPGDAPASTVDLNKIVAVLATDPEHGTLTSFGEDDGSFTYEPGDDFNGTDEFTYRASDGSAKSALVTVTITVNPVNDAPVAVDDDDYTTPEETELVVLVAEGVLANDVDVDNATAAVDELMALLVEGQGPGKGTLILDPEGSFTYTPNTGATGEDSFTYKVNDGTEDSNEATVTIQITPPGP